jgi:hypothetical protein
MRGGHFGDHGNMGTDGTLTEFCSLFWTWSEDFQLHEQFVELSEQLGPFGFAEIGEDTNLLLRCCAAVLVEDAAPDSLMQLNGQTVREGFTRILNGVKGAVDYLRANFNAFSLANLPFPTGLLPCRFSSRSTKITK